ncbi:ribosome biogenesis GTP-binding protein YihA/YsxC, partial [Bacteroidales bacterium OttesenSCG-928-B11]|nr:ribosome biogenesis GTP-binding protein YihA/YsxC [Bacteroidales bacterium OttesenSCG-928-B11]
MLGNNKSLAKTSSKPGKTQTINHFIVNNKWYLVDLPGYGYATISKTMREMWIRMIEDYFVNRKNLQAVFVLVDARIEPQNNDIEFVNNLGELGIPFSIIFTKTDKISKMKLQENVKNFSDKMLEYWEELPPFFITSAHKNIGRDEILNYIDEINKQIDENTEIL